MDLIRNLISLLVLLSLAACDPTATPPEQPKAEAAKIQPVQAALTSKATKAEPAVPAVSKPVVDLAAAPKIRAADQVKPKPAVVASRPKPDEPKAPLDMSLNPNVFDPLQPLEPLDDQTTALLPPLFGEKIEPDDGFQLNGKLISNERDDDYWQSVEGAQLQFEFKR
jgi:hypothetical protein